MFDSCSRTGARGLVLAAACAAALGLGACGDDDEETIPPDTGIETTEATETTNTTATTQPPDGEASSETQSNFADALRAQLEAAGVSPNQVDCVVEELEGTVTDDAIAEAQEQLESGGEIPQEIVDASMHAAQQCLAP